MGVSIGWKPINGKRVRWLSPGWRSMMQGLLEDNGLSHGANKADAERLREIGKTQLKGEREPPFDHADSIARAFEELAKAVEKHDRIDVVCVW